MIAKVWVKGCIPNEWKKAVNILIHKKGESEDPANFRPITLEPVTLKIFTACLRDKIFEFLKENNYIEHNLQKGFIPKLSGTFKHTAQMGHIIDKARLKQRSLIVTLLDLKNAFGEVNHNLISAVYKYHHIPEQIDHLVKDLYSNFNTTIMTSHFKIPFIKVGRGVLHGDCLSPLTFNMCFNTFIQYIKSKNFQQLGFKFKGNFEPRHWFQFADDASVISGTEHENQILLNAFTRWCQWS